MSHEFKYLPAEAYARAVAENLAKIEMEIHTLQMMQAAHSGPEPLSINGGLTVEEAITHLQGGIARLEKEYKHVLEGETDDK